MESDERGIRLVSDYEKPTGMEVARLTSAVFLLALGARVLYTFALGWNDYRPMADAQDYSLIAQGIAGGRGFARLGGDFAWRATAFRPPLTPYLISVVYRISPANVLAARIVMCVIGAITAVLVFFIAVSAFPGKNRWRTGLVAGTIAAFYPFLIIHSTSLLIEPLHVLLVCLLILVMLRTKLPARPAPLVGVGLIGGLIALNRPDGIAYGAMLALWAATLASPTPRSSDVQVDERGERPSRQRASRLRRRLARAAVVLTTFIVLMAPWWIRNYSVFHAVIPSTTSTGDLVLGANNANTYQPGIFYGYWSYEDVVTGEAGAYVFADEVTADRKHLSMGASYAAGHPLDLLAVMPIRALRGWELWDPIGNAKFGTSWGRPIWMGVAALIAYYPVMILALFGAWVCRRDWRRLAPLYALPLYVTLMFILATGEMRYRAAVDAVMCVFAAHGVFAISDSLRRRRRRDSRPATSGPAAQAETTAS